MASLHNASGRVRFDETDASPRTHTPSKIPVSIRNSSSQYRNAPLEGTNSYADSSDPVEIAKGIFFQGMQTVEPSTLIKSHVQVQGSLLKLKDEKGTTIDLSHYNKKHIVGFGKACLPMAETLRQLLNRHVDRTIVSLPIGSRKSKDDCIEVYCGAKDNISDKDSFTASKAIVELVQSCTPKDLLIVLISSGSSALLTYPIPPITLDDKEELVSKLLNMGCTTNEMNTFRRRISLVKGGGLVGMCNARKILTLIISDVSGSPLQVIGGGPTVENFDAPDAASAIIEKYGLDKEVPPTISEVLSRPPPPKNLEKFNNVINFIIGDNKIALDGAATAAKKCGLHPYIVTTKMFGKAADVGYNLAHVVESLAFCISRKLNFEDPIVNSCLEAIKKGFKQDNWPLKDILPDLYEEFNRPSKGICLLFGGETTVTIRGGGKGGRNQELALSAGIKLDLCRNVPHVKDKIAILSAGTDSSDGPDDAAGAVIEGCTIHNAQLEGLSPVAFLKDNDSFHFFERASGGKYHIFFGHTEINLMVMVVIVILKKSVKKART